MNFEITGIILAGGQSKRMGYNKALAKLKGKPLIEYSLNALRGVTGNIVLSVGSEMFQYKNLPSVTDIIPDCGPVGGIWSALRYSTTVLNLVISCDMPFIPVPLLKLLVKEAEEYGAPVTLPVDNKGCLQPLCAVYNQSILPLFNEAVIQKKLKLMDLISEAGMRQIKPDQSHDLFSTGNFFNMNTPADLKNAEDQWYPDMFDDD
jgi:molybdopterin-guanine dinucleotide biosynthesis protein A